jgi:Tol biopolymer transport system component
VRFAQRSAVTAGCLATLLLLGDAALAVSSGAPTTQRVNVSSRGAQASGPSDGPGLSASGRFAVFASDARNLVRGDTNHVSDVFVRDLKTHKTRRVSVNSEGRQANGATYVGSISSSGRYVTFSSYATNLAGHDRNGRRPDIYLRDRKLHTTIRVNVTSSGRQGSAPVYQAAPVSADGHAVAFVSWSHMAPEDGNSFNPDVFIRNLKTHKTELVSVGLGGTPGDRFSGGASISNDGRFVAFNSYSANLVPNDRGHGPDVFVRDLTTDTTTMASVDSNGQQKKGESYGAQISADGRFIAFSSLAPLVDDDTNGLQDAYLRDLTNGTTERVSLGQFGNQSLHEQVGAGGVSAHGEYVSFQSSGEDFMPGDTNGPYGDGFVRDVAHHTTTRVSVNTAGEEAKTTVTPPTISADGRFVGFWSDANNLVPGDTNGDGDLFVRGPLRP